MRGKAEHGRARGQTDIVLRSVGARRSEISSGPRE
jgi:hypothetical protein